VLQAQQEELRVTNEELEEQSRALKESQARLEEQQAELEATNSELELQAQQLELQKEALAQSQQDAERANRYKSEFLANMSHELRTPLNSTLILARLLADNKEGRLSPDQVRYAETIYASGNSLLTLINDILDLAKIEAGAVEVTPEPVEPTDLVEELHRTFQPWRARRLSTSHRRRSRRAGTAHDRPAAPAADPDEPAVERLQVHRARLGHAAGRTGRRGRRRLRGARHRHRHSGGQAGDHLRGVPAGRRQHAPPVRRHRPRSLDFPGARPAARGAPVGPEHGGSRQHVHAASARRGPGAPARRTPTGVAGADAGLPDARAAAARTPRAAAPAAPLIPDDRHRRQHPGRLILVIEDDAAFARILLDLAHELDFDCVVAGTIDEGLRAGAGTRTERHPARRRAARRLGADAARPAQAHARDATHPGAHGVGERLHADGARAGRHRLCHQAGARREDLVDAIRKVEARLDERLRRVLVVEDDPTMRSSITALLQLDGVAIEAVGTAREALDRLASQSFDCVVLDLNLPDASGYDVLEQMSQSEQYSFPPVIVYTGRRCRGGRERLRRYSRSVIVKGARSPERLLDEVTLFLHQVESRLPSDSRGLLRLARERDDRLHRPHDPRRRGRRAQRVRAVERARAARRTRR
jgi:CheY-like chemotaxis protein